MKNVTIVIIVLLTIIMLIGAGCFEDIKALPSPVPTTQPTLVVQFSKVPVTADDYYERAQFFAMAKDWDSAIKDCDKIISLDRFYTMAYYLKAVAFMGQKDYIQANKSFEDVLNTGEEPTKDQIVNLKSVIDLAVLPGELVMLSMSASGGKGGSCLASPNFPYHSTVSLSFFINAIEGIEVSRIEFDPGFGDPEKLNKIRSFSGYGIKTILIVMTTSSSPLENMVCTVYYKDKSESSYKKSNGVQ